jgi:hypothetical protein
MGKSELKEPKTWMKVLDGVFDFKDKANSSLGREKSLEWNKRMLKEHWDYLMGLDLPGLVEILNKICENWNSGLYESVMLSFEERTNESRDFTYEESAHNKLMTLAAVNLPPRSLKTIAFSKPFSWEDSLNIWFSGLDARLIFNLDKFDQIEDFPEPTSEFFQKLGETQIANQKITDFYLKITDLMIDIENEIFGMHFRDFNSDYVPTEGLFIQLLAGCNAVHNNREGIVEEDIIMAYRTFLKLMKTDVTQYKAIPEIVRDMDEDNPDYGDIIVCKSCGSYYKLEPGESVDDFESCHCGGGLKQVHDERSH